MSSQPHIMCMQCSVRVVIDIVLLLTLHLRSPFESNAEKTNVDIHILSYAPLRWRGYQRRLVHVSAIVLVVSRETSSRFLL